MHPSSSHLRDQNGTGAGWVSVGVCVWGRASSSQFGGCFVKQRDCQDGIDICVLESVSNRVCGRGLLCAELDGFG